ncbi:DUF937 domain-containing protein [Gemmatimonadota bacterium]
MSSLVEMLTAQLGSGQALGQLSRQLGADEGSTQNALGAALPVLLGALARNTAQSNGAQSLDQALGKHDGGILDNLTGFLGAPDVDDGNGILRHMLGDRRSSVESGVSKASGLDPSMIAKLLPLLAPIVMGALGRQKREKKLDPTGLSKMLGAERQQIEAANPAAGMLGQLLDQDGDGSVADDIAKLGGGFLGSLFKRR